MIVGGDELKVIESFESLGSFVEKNEGFDDLKHRIDVGGSNGMKYLVSCATKEF